MTTEAVPVERVRPSKDQDEDEETVNVDVRNEQIEMEGDDASRLRDDR